MFTVNQIVKYAEATKKVENGITYVLYGCDSCGGGYVKSSDDDYNCPLCGSNHVHGYTKEEEKPEINASEFNTVELRGVMAHLSLTSKNSGLMNLEMPILVIEVDGGNTGWLSPFRGYCFQVSRNLEGVGRYTASDVVGLGNIVEAFKLYDEQLRTTNTKSNYSLYSSNHTDLALITLYSFAKNALVEFLNKNSMTMSNVSCADEAIFYEFVGKTKEWVINVTNSYKK